MIDLIEELTYLYQAIYNKGYFKKQTGKTVFTIEGVKISLATSGIKQRENEPISFIIFAKTNQIFEKFLQKTGWFGADPVTFINSIRGTICNLFNLSYDKSPLTPYFWMGKTQSYNLQKPTKNHTIRERHHARFWKSNLKTKSGEIYVGMASFDKGMGKLFSHSIDPNIDKEREYLFNDFKKTKMIKTYKKVKFIDQTERKIFNGDSFFTEGKGYLIYLK